LSDDTPAKPRLQDRLLVALLAELAGGVVLGLLLARLGGLVGAWLGRGGATTFADLVGAILGTFLGYIAGVALGMYGAARLLRRRGSFWLGLLGALLGGVLVALLAEPLALNRTTAVLSFAVFFIVPVLGLAGFNLRRNGRLFAAKTQRHGES
jgi:integral membrane sensor domain MASE1